jgi:glycosyltransferase involved in cell wall biosynthesis
VLLVGRLQPVKRFHMIVPLMKEILRSDPDVCAEIAGAGECRTDIATAIDRAGLAHAVRLLGHQSDLTDVYARSHVLVHFRDDEGFGRIYLEAQHRGLPVVCVGGGGTSEVVCDGKTGFVHESSDVSGMARSVLRLKHEPPLYASFSANAHDWAQRFSVPRMAAAYESVLMKSRTDGDFDTNGMVVTREG